MARRKQEGNRFFRLDVDFFSDKKVKILKARYGADGVTLYLYILCEIYKAGYYLKIDEDFEFIVSDDLSMDSNKVKQVLNFLLNKSLFDNTLFSSDKVLTSAGIQRRYQLGIKERMRKSKEPLEVGRYWLLKKEDTEPFIKCTLFEDIPGKCDSFSGKNESNSMEKSANKSKVNNNKNNTVFQSPELESAFQMYLLVREHNYGAILPEQVQALREDLLSLSNKPEEQIAIVKKATAGGYKEFRGMKKGKRTSPAKKKDNFNNFDGRSYDQEMYMGLIEK